MARVLEFFFLGQSNGQTGHVRNYLRKLDCLSLTEWHGSKFLIPFLKENWGGPTIGTLHYKLLWDLYVLYITMSSFMAHTRATAGHERIKNNYYSFMARVLDNYSFMARVLEFFFLGQSNGQTGHVRNYLRKLDCLSLTEWHGSKFLIPFLKENWGGPTIGTLHYKLLWDLYVLYITMSSFMAHTRATAGHERIKNNYYSFMARVLDNYSFMARVLEFHTRAMKE